MASSQGGGGGFEHTKDCPRSRPMSGSLSYSSRQQHQQQQQPPPPQMQHRPGQSGYPSHLGGHQEYPPAYGYGPPPYCHPPLPQWSAEEEEMKYGPFSDGEAETLRKGTRSCKKTMRTRGGAAPHYATMSRAHELASYRNHHQPSSLDSNEGAGSYGIKYTSQPHLNGSVSDYLGHSRGPPHPHQPPHSSIGTPDVLTPLSIKTSITFKI